MRIYNSTYGWGTVIFTDEQHSLSLVEFDAESVCIQWIEREVEA